jgi:hypothetical protein
MPHGPVPRFTLDLIDEPELSEGAYWHRHISSKSNHEVGLAGGEVPEGHLSSAEETLIGEAFSRYGHLTARELRDLTRTLPEWVDPGGTFQQIDPADILRYSGYSEEAIRDIENDLEESRLADRLFG